MYLFIFPSLLLTDKCSLYCYLQSDLLNSLHLYIAISSVLRFSEQMAVRIC